MNLLCRLNSDGKFESVEAVTDSLSKLMLEDRKYGVLKPNAQGFITYRVYNGDKEMPQKIAEYIAKIAYMGWIFETNLKFRRAKDNEDPIVKIYFRDESEDPNLFATTIAYHYYPVAGQGFRGILVINKKFYYTVHGNAVSLHDVDPLHYPDPKTAPKNAQTWDLDRILRHEDGHGIFGLVHDTETGNTMSNNYEKMSDELTARDIRRAQAKTGKSKWSSINVYLKIRKWYYEKKSETIPEFLKP